MNGVEGPPTAIEASNSSMPVNENVVAADEGIDEGTIAVTESVSSHATEEDKEKVRLLLLHQLEYYFSSANLSKDQYLVSQMDDQQYVPIWTIANFNNVKKLTTDIDLITEVLKSSNLLQVDDKGEKVRPNQPKFVLILREIPRNTTIQDIMSLFEGDQCPDFLSCEYAGNYSWYIAFDSEADIQKAYRHLREVVKTFSGQPIKARIKSKTHPLSTYPPTNPPQPPMPSRVVSPSYVPPPLNLFPAPAPAPAFGTAGQPVSYVAALPAQPQVPDTASSQSSSVPNSAQPQAQLYVVPPANQQWYAEPMHFANTVFPAGGHPSLPAYPQKRFGSGKNTLVSNGYLPSEPPRSMQQDGRLVQFPPMAPSGPDSQHQYLSAVAHMPVAGPPGMYGPMLQTYNYKSPIPGNKHNRHSGGMPNGVGPRYNNRNNYHSDHDISPRFQKRAMAQRYSVTRNHQHEHSNQMNSDSGAPYHNSRPSHMHDPFVSNRYYTRHNSGHDSSGMNGNRSGPRQNYKFQDGGDGQFGSSNMNDINNNAAKRQNFNDTVQNATHEYRSGNNSMRQRRNRKNGDSRSSSARPSPPASAGNGADHDGVQFNLEQTSFPPLPGTTATNAGTNPIHISQESSSKKPQATEEPYKNSLKMNLERAPPAPVATPHPQPPVASSYPPVAKEQTMQMEHKEPHLKSEPVEHKEPSNPVVTSVKSTSRASKSSNHSKPVNSGDVRSNEKEKVAKVNQKQSKAKNEATQKGKNDSTTSNTSEKSTVPTADSDAGKKLSYAEMLRKKSAKPVTSPIQADGESKSDGKSDTEDNAPTVPPVNVPQKSTEPPAVVENGEVSPEVKSLPSPDGSDDSDDKPWESAGPSKRSHRNDRAPANDHSHHNGYEQRSGRGGGYSGRNNRGRGRGKGGYGRGGGRFGGNNYGGRDKIIGNNNERQTASNGDASQRKR